MNQPTNAQKYLHECCTYANWWQRILFNHTMHFVPNVPDYFVDVVGVWLIHVGFSAGKLFNQIKLINLEPFWWLSLVRDSGWSARSSWSNCQLFPALPHLLFFARGLSHLVVIHIIRSSMDFSQSIINFYLYFHQKSAHNNTRGYPGVMPPPR